MPIFKKAFDKFEEKTLPLGEILLSSKEHWTFATASEFPNGRRSRGKLCWGLWEIISMRSLWQWRDPSGGVGPPFPCHLQGQVRLDKGDAQQEKVELGLVIHLLIYQQTLSSTLCQALC